MNPLFRRIALGWLLAAAVCGAETPTNISDAVEQLEQEAAKAPPELGVEFHVKAAQAVHAEWPELSRQLLTSSVARLRSGGVWRITPEVMGTLAKLDPDSAISVLPRMPVYCAGPVIDALGQLHRIADARSVYRAALARGASVTAAFGLFLQLHNEKSPEAGDVYRDMLSGFSFAELEPEDAFWIDSQLTELIQQIDPAEAIEGTIRILNAASDPAYGKSVTGRLTGNFRIGSRPVITTDPRDTVLLMAGARLFALAPAEFERRKALFARWGSVGPISVRSIRTDGTSLNARTEFTTGKIPAQTAAVRGRIEELADQPFLNDDLVARLATEIQRLPPGWGKLYAARQLCDVALSRDASSPALGAAALALMLAIRDCHPVLNPGQVATSFSEDYIRLAEMIRYADVRTIEPDPAIEAALALLTLRERVLEQIGFAVTTLNGKPRTIFAVPGKITLITFVTNVCEQWKSQCDRPLPALDQLYSEFGNKGLAVFAIVEEDRESFTASLDGESLSVPLFIDPDDICAAIFAVPRRHETFLFNREGKLVSCKIGVRTKGQLSEMVEKAGLK